ncbi:hypothetical protein FGO68_gene3772 [Halteria grandinella]|uniref:Thioredoxin domain-containing protein n=1 Tax=Halteria grandinella TaxID=5974 RepID=A0A8J8NNB9_HALGN|nr:hypothetical protein FGO68_gene3772 [Halteria grandinella]
MIKNVLFTLHRSSLRHSQPQRALLARTFFHPQQFRPFSNGGPIFTGPTPPGEKQAAQPQQQQQKPKPTLMQEPKKVLTDMNGNPLSGPPKSEPSQYADHPDIIELKTVEEWVPVVMQEEKPVILDCYADWCGPCKKLTPALETITASNESRFKLVKVNIDKLPQIASGLKVQSIPHVFLIYQGKIVDNFLGIPKPEKLQDFFNKAVVIHQIATNENVQNSIVEQIKTLIEADNLEQAFGILTDLSNYDSIRDKFGFKLVVEIAYCVAFKFKDYTSAHKMLAELHDEELATLDEFDKGLLDKIRAELELNKDKIKPEEPQAAQSAAEAWQDPETGFQPGQKEVKPAEEIIPEKSEEELQLSKKIEESGGKDLDALFAYAKWLFEKDRYQESAEQCFAIIKINKTWNERAAQTFLVEVFNKIGPKTEEVASLRKKLSKLLF